MILIDDSCCLHLRKDNNNNTKSDCTTFNLILYSIIYIYINRYIVFYNNTIVKIQHTWHTHTHTLHIIYDVMLKCINVQIYTKKQHMYARNMC